MFLASFDATRQRYRSLLNEVSENRLQFANMNFDTGQATRLGAGSKTPFQAVGSGGRWRWHHRCDHLVSGLLQFSDHFREARALALGAYRGTTFFIAHSLVQNLPDETAQAVRNGPDRLLIFQARLQALKDHFKNASLHLDGGVCGLIE